MRKKVVKRLRVIAMQEFQKSKNKVESRTLKVVSKSTEKIHKPTGHTYRLNKITEKYPPASFKFFFNTVKKMYLCGDLKLN